MADAVGSNPTVLEAWEFESPSEHNLPHPVDPGAGGFAKVVTILGWLGLRSGGSEHPLTIVRVHLFLGIRPGTLLLSGSWSSTAS